MSKRIINIVVLNLILFIISDQLVYSWGGTGHKFINRKAVMHLPSDMNAFKADSLFYEAHASDADNRKISSDTTFLAESPRHFLDIDDYPYFKSMTRNLDSLIMIYGWQRVKENGTNPWFVKWFMDSLIAQLTRNDLAKVKQTASDIGHYVGDGYQPLHCTLNYDGQLTGNRGIHSRYETTMLNSYQAQINIQTDSIYYIGSPIDFIFEYIIHSNSLVDSIMLADNYAKSVSGYSGSGTAPASYYSALWEKTERLTKDQLQRSTTALASIWYTAWVNSKTTSVDDSKLAHSIPEGYILEQNYPNPFNPGTQITYQLSNYAHVTLKVYNIYGQEVSTLVNGFQDAGAKTVYFNATQLSSGIYFSKLVTAAGKNIYTSTKKMILLR
ncbi:MAG: T9SS type A sorting domain-containing protein [Bacteroidota bacterium]|nr:T9SS type A sorting domain-containing protein [Bacteroidota bacterium]